MQSLLALLVLVCMLPKVQSDNSTNHTSVVLGLSTGSKKVSAIKPMIAPASSSENNVPSKRVFSSTPTTSTGHVYKIKGSFQGAYWYSFPFKESYAHCL